MAFERAFVKAGGLLGAGSDPCCISAIAGYGDQRNYELLIEAGFTPEETVKIMTANGAKILGFDKWLGTIQPGMQADLVVVNGDRRSHAGGHPEHRHRLPTWDWFRLRKTARVDQGTRWI